MDLVKQDIFRYGIVGTLLAIFLVGYGKPSIYLLAFVGVMAGVAYYQGKKKRKDAADLQSFLDKHHGE